MASASSSLCLLRLSALGDVTHVVPLVRTLQAARPVYFLEGAAISIPLPTYGAAGDLIPLMTTYDYGDGDIAVECYLLGDGEPSEAILHVHFEKGNLIYGFINS